MRTSTTAQKQWATARDWAEQRSVILELYIRQGKTLEDVVAIMEERYHFFATEWGLRKNRRKIPSGTAAATSTPGTMIASTSAPAPAPAPVPALASTSASTPSSSSSSSSPPSPTPFPTEPSLDPVDHHQQLLQQQLGQQLGQQQQPQPQQQQQPPPQPWQAAATAAAVDEARALMLRHFDSPDELRETERLVYAVRDWVSAASLTQTWQEDLASPVGSRDPSLMWLTRIFCATRLLRRGLTGPGFWAIDACCAEFSIISPSGHPGLLPAMLNAVVFLDTVDPALGRSFLRYAHNLGEALFPLSHPVLRLARAFRSVGVAGLRGRARLLLEGYKAAVQGSVGRHRGPVGRDISTHLLAYQGCAELADDMAHGREQMDTALDQWPRWFKVSLDSCDPGFLPMVSAFENLITMIPEEEEERLRQAQAAAVAGGNSGQVRKQQPKSRSKQQPQPQPQPKHKKLTREQLVQQWEALVEQVALCNI
ncbi:hypothetical protein SLS62_005337 [Diatrype stigma]|uniref:Clr5 domain-containing protein n=1 Tax=Diatrype stigma TaxID=117547 RepID=A0AAN9UV77_9PEZI